MTILSMLKPWRLEGRCWNWSLKHRDPGTWLQEWAHHDWAPNSSDLLGYVTSKLVFFWWTKWASLQHCQNLSSKFSKFPIWCWFCCSDDPVEPYLHIYSLDFCSRPGSDVETGAPSRQVAKPLTSLGMRAQQLDAQETFNGLTWHFFLHIFTTRLDKLWYTCSKIDKTIYHKIWYSVIHIKIYIIDVWFIWCTSVAYNYKYWDEHQCASGHCNNVSPLFM